MQLPEYQSVREPSSTTSKSFQESPFRLAESTPTSLHRCVVSASVAAVKVTLPPSARNMPYRFSAWATTRAPGDSAERSFEALSRSRAA